MVIYDKPDQIVSGSVRQLLDWWQAMAGSAGIPDRNQLDPCDLKLLLPNIMLSDVETSPFRIRFRLVGTRVAEASGIDFTGKFLDEIRPPAPGEPWLDEYRRAFAQRAPLFGEAVVTTKAGLPYSYEFAILPLRKGGREIAQFISIEDYQGLGWVKADLPPWKIT